MTTLRLLVPGPAEIGTLDGEAGEDVVQALADLYAYPDPVGAGGWVRSNMVSTLDGSATGGDDLSGSVSGPADRAVFGALRGLADVVMVGAGTARAEGYRVPAAKPEFALRRAGAGQPPAPWLALVTRSGRVDPALLASPTTLVVTGAAADVGALRDRLGGDRILVAGEDDVDPRRAVSLLAERGLRRILLEGGPTLLARATAADSVDDFCLTWSPRVVGGAGPRIAHGEAGTRALRLSHLIEADGTILGRWLVQR